MADDNAAPNNNRIRTADWRARVETKLDALINEVRADRQAKREQLKDHSRRLDRMELAVAKMEQGEKERARIEGRVDDVANDVKNLRREQRAWTGAATILAALGNFFNIKLPGQQ